MVRTPLVLSANLVCNIALFAYDNYKDEEISLTYKTFNDCFLTDSESHKQMTSMNEYCKTTKRNTAFSVSCVIYLNNSAGNNSILILLYTLLSLNIMKYNAFFTNRL